MSTLYWLFSNRPWWTPFTPLPPFNCYSTFFFQMLLGKFPGAFENNILDSVLCGIRKYRIQTKICILVLSDWAKIQTAKREKMYILASYL